MKDNVPIAVTMLTGCLQRSTAAEDYKVPSGISSQGTAQSTATGEAWQSVGLAVAQLDMWPRLEQLDIQSRGFENEHQCCGKAASRALPRVTNAAPALRAPIQQLDHPFQASLQSSWP